jgi:CheY-like chemotaxis protein
MVQPDHILIVDDNPINRRLLSRALRELGYRSSPAVHGRQALDLLRADPAAYDLVLLDILMPELDGYATLGEIKGDPALWHLPVIVITALDELDSAIRCIELGADDHLHKPFNAALLRARIGASLASKHMRDKERAYLHNVAQVTAAAAAVEAATFDPESLAPVAGRGDELGQLARIFQQMAREIYARELRLRRQIEQLRLDAEERRQAAVETVAVYVPMDRRLALARGAELPEHTRGAALVADISGFTPLTEALARELGLRRGAEEITRQVNRVYSPLIDAVDQHCGSVITFSGDAITCWFNEDDQTSAARRAVSCAVVMQRAMQDLGGVSTPAGVELRLAIKVAVAAGPVRRLLVGDSAVQQLEVLAGALMQTLSAGEQLARPGDVLVHEPALAAAGADVTVAGWRSDEATEGRFALVTDLSGPPALAPWPALSPDQLDEERLRPWLLPAVYAGVRSRASVFLSELRPAAALFLHFAGLDFDADEGAGRQLDAFIRWVQSILARYDAALLQVNIGEKGNYLYAAFGAPVAHEDDALRAVRAAGELVAPPPKLAFIRELRAGVAHGQMRAGAYGGTTRRTYGVLGHRTNLAARLMQAAADILCDEAVYEQARARVPFTALPPLMVKGKAELVAVYRPVTVTSRAAVGQIDRLAPPLQLTIKVASVIGPVFAGVVLRAIHPADTTWLDEELAELAQLGLIAPLLASDTGRSFAFADPATHETIYSRLLFAQRRQLHRAVAEWYERAHGDDLATYAPLLAHHWGQAEDVSRAVQYLEQAGEAARLRGDDQEALRYFSASLDLSARAAVLSAEYGAGARQVRTAPAAADEQGAREGARI